MNANIANIIIPSAKRFEWPEASWIIYLRAEHKIRRLY